MANCQALKSDGRACKAHTVAGSRFCFFHNPNATESRREAQRKGGSKGTRLQVISSAARDFDLSNPKGVAELLAYAANRVVRGELDSKSAYALGYLADCALRAHNAGTVTERLDWLELLQKAEDRTPLHQDDAFESRFDEEEDSAEPKPAEAGGAHNESEH